MVLSPLLVRRVHALSPLFDLGSKHCPRCWSAFRALSPVFSPVFSLSPVFVFTVPRPVIVTYSGAACTVPDAVLSPTRCCPRRGVVPGVWIAGTVPGVAVPGVDSLDARLGFAGAEPELSPIRLKGATRFRRDRPPASRDCGASGRASGPSRRSLRRLVRRSRNPRRRGRRCRCAAICCRRQTLPETSPP